MKTFIVLLSCGKIERITENDYWSWASEGLLAGSSVVMIED